jgi:hypothetical protein
MPVLVALHASIALPEARQVIGAVHGLRFGPARRAALSRDVGAPLGRRPADARVLEPAVHPSPTAARGDGDLSERSPACPSLIASSRSPELEPSAGRFVPSCMPLTRTEMGVGLTAWTALYVQRREDER